MKTVKDLMNSRRGELYTINSSQTIYQALILLAEKNIGALPVIEEQRLVGIVSERDYARKVILKGASSLDTMVKKIMTVQIITASPKTTLEECLSIMKKHKIRHLPILKDDELVDFISLSDLLNEILECKERLIAELSKN